MTDKTSHSKLFQLIKQYEANANTEHGTDFFGKAYEFILKCLDNDNNQCIHSALKTCQENQDEIAYDSIISLVLTTIHRFNFLDEDKEYASTLFVVPYFTINDNAHNRVIHYPPINQIQDIFRKEFFDKKLIDQPEQLYIPGIKINAEKAYNLDFSDWFTLHKEALSKALNPETDQHYATDITIPVPEEGDLSFFTILIIHEDNENTPQPAICDLQNDSLLVEDALESIEQEVSLLSGTGQWCMGIPSHCENALDFGLEIKQDFALDSFFKSFIQREDIVVGILPLEQADMAMIAWNTQTQSIEKSLDLHYYSYEEDEFIDNLLKQISFHEIRRTYIFENSIGLNTLEDLKDFDLESMVKNEEVLVLEKPSSNGYTVH